MVKSRSLPLRGVFAGAAAVVMLTGCGGGEVDNPNPPEADLQARLDQAKRSLDDAASVQFSMSTDDLPSGTIGLLDAEGVGTHDPAFEGEANVSRGGASLPLEIIAVGADVYAKLGFVPVFTSVDPAAYGAPNPALLLDPDHGVSTFLTSTEGVAGGDEVRDGEDILTRISGILPGRTVSTLFPAADTAADFAVEYRLADDDELRAAVLSGPFYPEADVTYTLSLDPSDETVEITAP